MNDLPNSNCSHDLENVPNQPRAVLLDDFASGRYGRILEREGIHTLRTGSETEAWKFLGYPEMRLLIQDFDRGPGSLGGLEFMKRMSECRERRHIPVVMISGSGRKRIARAFFESFEMPLDEILLLLEKPLSYADIHAIRSTLHTLTNLRPWPTK